MFILALQYSRAFLKLIRTYLLAPVQLEQKKTLQQGCSTTLVAALDTSITGMLLFGFVITFLDP